MKDLIGPRHRKANLLDHKQKREENLQEILYSIDAKVDKKNHLVFTYSIFFCCIHKLEELFEG